MAILVWFGLEVGEMIVVTIARKPLAGTVAGNVAEFGTGGINIEGCRVGDEEIKHGEKHGDQTRIAYGAFKGCPASWHVGRWPANLVLQHCSRCVYQGTKRIEENPTPKVEHLGYEGTSVTGFLREGLIPTKSHMIQTERKR